MRPPPTVRPPPPPAVVRRHHAGRQRRRVRCRSRAPGAVRLRAGLRNRGGRPRHDDVSGGGGDAWQGTSLGWTCPSSLPPPAATHRARRDSRHTACGHRRVPARRSYAVATVARHKRH